MGPGRYETKSTRSFANKTRAEGGAAVDSTREFLDLSCELKCKRRLAIMSHKHLGRQGYPPKKEKKIVTGMKTELLVKSRA